MGAEELRIIPLTQGHVAWVSPEDYGRTAIHKWSLFVTKRGFKYAVRDAGKSSEYLHRFILGADPKQLVDHRNGNGLDCQRENIRIATRSQNNQNRSRKANSKSPYKGVRLKCGRWQARITSNGRRVSLGHFDTAEAAAVAYDASAAQLHGEFARLNFPEASPQSRQGRRCG